LDRHSIEKHDFPIGRRGYDQAAVDAHLSWLADEVDSERSSGAAELDELKRAHAQGGTLASTASEYVRSIVAAAESSADEIKSAAEDDARRVGDRADAESQTTRERAAREARELVDKVSEATAGMLERIGSIESEFGSVIGPVRSGCERMAAELERLQANLDDVAGLDASRARPVI
jgi:cell division septum initiation protein DivIVA